MLYDLKKKINTIVIFFFFASSNFMTPLYSFLIWSCFPEVDIHPTEIISRVMSHTCLARNNDLQIAYNSV